jgi:ribose/xylose/arabinose/galactoside ABC-type transport system permease subunit
MARISHDPLQARLVLLVVLWVVALVVMSLLSPYFLQARTIPYLLQYIPILGLLGLGQTLIMLAGGPGIDLSVGSMVSLVGVLVGTLVGAGTPVLAACAAGLAFGALLGLVNGTLVNLLRIPSLMATLATMFAYGGLALALTEGRPLGGIPRRFCVARPGHDRGSSERVSLHPDPDGRSAPHRADAHPHRQSHRSLRQ